MSLWRVALTMASAVMAINSEYNRPLLHFTPDHGWINDPNGPIFDAKAALWHLYYQYNENNIQGGNPLSWGHATSKDLTSWKREAVAITPQNPSDGAFSGSTVIDRENTSGFFPDSVDPNQRIVAIYTLDQPGSQTQQVAWSEDGGYTFKNYSGNPVLDINNSQFRDPKVFWHAPTSQWIMVAVKSQHFQIQIYGSVDLKTWSLHLNFSSGLYGFQYECPGLIEIPVEGTNQTKWVMFLAINPGMPTGGSANQYFIGDFDGFKFTPIDHQTRYHDFGKDYYAFQTFSDVPADIGVLGIAWASNWQYARKTPTEKWRGAMSLVRNLTLAEVQVNPQKKELMLKQQPVIGASAIPNVLVHETNVALSPKTTVRALANSTGIFDFEVVFTLLDTEGASIEHTTLEVVISSNNVNGKQDSIRIGYDKDGEAFFVDRGTNSKINRNPFFTDKVSVFSSPLNHDSAGNSVYKLRGIIDKSVAEVYVNDGVFTSTNTFYMDEGLAPETIEVSSDATGLYRADVKISELSLRG